MTYCNTWRLLNLLFLVVVFFFFALHLIFPQTAMSSKVVYLNHKNKPKRRCIETGSGHRGVADVRVRVIWLQCGRLTSRWKR